ncbi:MAG: precorrin-6Y C5,15-methyltransferase (decarboxylating) subunit CbiT, partial [Desulfobacteraceae bacterium]
LVTDTQRKVYVGMPEEWFDHQNGLITKAEIRAVSLSKLRLESHHIMWDLGAGSGSVGIEGSVFINKGRIFAVEKDPERVAQIETNLRRFGVHNVEVLCQMLPEGLETLPAPDRVFVGGGGQRLKSILQAVIRNLKPNGIIVVNTVLLASMQTALDCLQDHGFKTEMIQMQVNRSQMIAQGKRLEAQNPVWIISGQDLTKK